MKKILSFLLRIYTKLIIENPIITIVVLSISILFLSYFSKDFQLDVSPDSLVLENDQDLEYYRSIAALYGTSDYLIITYTPKKDLFSTEVLDDLEKLITELSTIDNVESITSLLNVPLLKSPLLSLAEVTKEPLTLNNPKTDFGLAKKELKNSPLYRNRLISADGQTTAIQVNFAYDHTYHKLRKKRDELRKKQLTETLSRKEIIDLNVKTEEFKAYNASLSKQQNDIIKRIRRILKGYKKNAEIHLGGIPMITSDMIDFIKHDLKVFGIGAILIMATLLIFVLRKLQWITLPILTAGATCISMLGFLGIAGWQVTVVSANFLSLLIIFTLSLTIHLIVRYLELSSQNPDKKQSQLVLDMLSSKFFPCLYTILTTILAFSSLIISNIRPVMDFGWIMVIGLIFSFILSFTFFPATLILFTEDRKYSVNDITTQITFFFAKFVKKQQVLFVSICIMLISFSIYGIFQLTVENRFIDYFKKSTEIYQGMYLIDQKLGGTTPLDLIIDAPPEHFENSDEDDLDFEEDFIEDESNNITSTSYWFTSYMFSEIDMIHDYLNSLEETGKVLSISTAMKLLKELNNNQEIENYELGILYKKLPKDIKNNLLAPYLAKDGNQIRLTMRVYESDKNLKRQALINKITTDLKNVFNLKDDQFRLTGMLVLYNNMLQSLFKSQILTLGTVFAAIFIMFIFLFKSIKVALIAICPNLVAALLVLGLMGIFGIPLNIMTITIAAISVGIAVDDTIHYLHRFEEEIIKDGDYQKAIHRSHSTIGKAMYYTSLIITIGFSILVLSNFIPTIYFGVLTALAMITALIADLTILPFLLNLFKPYKEN